MFRKMRRSQLELSGAETEEVLARVARGVLAVRGEDGYPYAFPMDYVYMDGKIYFHCAKTGHKLDALAADDRASFCVMDEGYRREGEWALNIRSVVVFGRVRKITDAAETERTVRRLALKYYPTAQAVEEEIPRSIARVQMLEMTIDHMTGKRVNES